MYSCVQRCSSKPNLYDIKITNNEFETVLGGGLKYDYTAVLVITYNV